MQRVVEPIPRRAKVAFVLIVAALALPVALWLLDLDDPVPADWRVDPTASVAPADRVIPIIVNERNCASGHSADGRIVVDVSYTPDDVHLDVGVRPRGGDQDCQGNPDTPHDVQLREPLGEREVTGEVWPEP